MKSDAYEKELLKILREFKKTFFLTEADRRAQAAFGNALAIYRELKRKGLGKA